MAAARPMPLPPDRRPEISYHLPGEGFVAPVVEGIDPDRHATDDVVCEWLRSLLWASGVICLRQPAKLTDGQHRAIVSMVGPVKELLAVNVDGHEVRYGDTKQHIDSGHVAGDGATTGPKAHSEGGNDVRPGLFEFFHTDDSYVARPALATVLHARALPATGRGATRLLDMRAAYALLDAEQQAQLDGLHAVHAFNNHDAFPPRPSAHGQLEALPPVSHPIVRAHPVTGGPALYFDLDRAHHVADMPEAQGRALLQSLQDLAEERAPRYAHEWQPHDVLIWDNASVQHRAGGDFLVGEPRRFWRFMVEGPTPVAFRRSG